MPERVFYELKSPIVHNHSRVEALPSGALAISVPSIAWAYAAALPLRSGFSGSAPEQTSLSVKVAVGDVRGEIELCVLSRATKTQRVLAQRRVAEVDANSTIELLAGPTVACGDFVIRNGSSSGASGRIELRSVDTRVEASRQEELHYELRSPIFHNHCRVEPLSAGGVAISVPTVAWAYAVAFPLHLGRSALEEKSDGFLLARIAVGDVQGEVCACIVSRENGQVLVQRQLNETDANETAELLGGPISVCGDLLIRNGSSSGGPGRIEIRSVEALTVDPKASRWSVEMQDWSRGTSALNLTSLVQRFWPMIAKDNSETKALDPSVPSVVTRVVDVDDLGSELGYASPFQSATFNRQKSYLDRRMESDDSEILAYLYRNHRPHRHLEFGTWEGFGAALCAANCTAEVWTLNLPEGERTSEGAATYNRAVTMDEGQLAGVEDGEDARLLQTDAGDWIGWRYRAAGYTNRVRQILVDSTEWDASSFADGFFDSILIDGGHSTDVVISDTNKSLRLLRSGGIMLWHDFCPAALPMGHSKATRGVVNALHAKWREWAPNFDRLFWIRPSYILLGRKELARES